MYQCAGERVESPLRLLLSESENEPGKMMVLANEPLLTEEQRAQNVLPSASEASALAPPGNDASPRDKADFPCQNSVLEQKAVTGGPRREGKGREGLMWWGQG